MGGTQWFVTETKVAPADPVSETGRHFICTIYCVKPKHFLNANLAAFRVYLIRLVLSFCTPILHHSEQIMECIQILKMFSK